MTEAYDQIYKSPVPEDAWHAYSTLAITSFVREVTQRCQPRKALDAGCGHWRYLDAENAVLLDLLPSVFSAGERATLGDVETLPFRSGAFDLALVVGSVINYAEPRRSLQELARVLRPGGTLILEYERLRSRSRLLMPGRREASVQTVSYRGVLHTLTVYDDGYMSRLVEGAGLTIVRRGAFHIVSSLASLFMPLMCAAAFARADALFTPRLFGRFAENALVECVKV